jgi:hypothetical protein
VTEALINMALLMACGVAWRAARPGQLDVDQVRRALTGLVYYVLLPALILKVLWKAPLDIDTPRVAFAAAIGVLSGILLSGWACRMCKLAPGMTGAIILASAFPNATYLGLPVLESVFGSVGRSVAIQYDLFACTPLLLTVGILVAQQHGSASGTPSLVKGIFRVPALWAALVAVGMNFGQVPLPRMMLQSLNMMGGAVAPLMLIVLGLSLRWESLNRSYAQPIALVAAIQLVAMPAIVWFVAGQIGLSGHFRVATILEAAMPSMVLGLVICDRYGLDTNFYGAAVTATTVMSFASLPIWFALL